MGLLLYLSHGYAKTLERDKANVILTPFSYLIVSVAQRIMRHEYLNMNSISAYAKYTEYRNAIQCGNEDSFDVFEFCGPAAKLGNIDALISIGDHLGYNKMTHLEPLSVFNYNYIKEIANVLPQAEFYLHLMIEQNSYKHILEKYLSKSTNELEELSKQYLINSAIHNFPIAMTVLGDYLIMGRLFPKSEKDGLKWLAKAIKNNYAPAMYSLGSYYNSNKNVSDNKTRATFWFAKAALLGDKHGIEMLALAFRDGTGIKKNKEMYLYLDRLTNPYYKNDIVCRPLCYETEMNRIMLLKIDIDKI